MLPKTKNFTVRLNEEQYSWLKEQAKQNNKNISDIICGLIDSVMNINNTIQNLIDPKTGLIPFSNDFELIQIENPYLIRNDDGNIVIVIPLVSNDQNKVECQIWINLINGTTKLDVHCSSKSHYPSCLFWLCKVKPIITLHNNFCVKCTLRLWCISVKAVFIFHTSFFYSPTCTFLH